ncbi:putative FBD-associated F-box protein At1g61330 [Primulina huaijiensis]|uniref:putative FBD-associated F-box protein At1g61330 n=1 Tax=Primulina huaijiensis TaxID=1492673 RepID=UPI003CC7044B
MASKEVRSRTNSPSSQERTKYFYVPEEVIEEILAHLPIKNAACLSILSKRFVNSWKLCRDLSFTKEISRKFSKEEFVKFINNFMLNFSDKNMHRFSLYFDPTDQIDLVQNWVHKAIQCGITELELDFTVAEQTYMLSFFLTNIENLKLLKLNKCELDFIPTPDGSCPLQQITLQNVRVPSFTLEAIFSNCLKLRTLELTNCEFLYNLKILAQDLKGFTVLVVKNCTGLLLMRINAPSLHSIHYEGKMCEFKFESDLPDLSDVVLNITSPRAFQLLPHRNNVINALANVTTLAVNHTFLEALCARFGKHGYEGMDFLLWKLKEFQLFVGGDSHINPLDIAIFLKKCPCVERVLIDLGKYAFAESVFWEHHGKNFFMSFGPTFPFLGYVKIKGFTLKGMHVSMARLFLKNAPYLRSLEIVGARNDMDTVRITPEWIARGIWTNAKIEIHEYIKDKSGIFPSVRSKVI